MKLTIILLADALVATVAFLIGCKRQSVQADAEAAVARGEYQFIALLAPDGKWTYPQVAGIPDWYFQTTGVRTRQTKPETREADI